MTSAVDRPDPLFSVIIPTFSRGPLLHEAIGSVLDQTVEDFECLVVDDGSPQPAELEVADARVRMIHRDRNGGPAAARNTGIAQARGQYVAFLDDDDLYEPTRLALALEGFRRAPVAVCWTRYLDGPNGSGRMLNGDVGAVILEAVTPHLGATSVERSVCPKFDERFDALQDVEWWLRLARSAGVATTPEVGCNVRRHQGHRHRNDLSARIRSSVQLMELHSDYFKAHPRAAAFRWKRIGVMAKNAGDHSLARRALLRSMRQHPHPGTAYRLVTSAVRAAASGRGPTVP